MADKKKSYPKQVAVIKREKKTFAIDAQLNRPGPNDDVPPLQMHNGFSVYNFSIVDKTTGTIITPTANIPAKEIPCVYERTRIAMKMLADRAMHPTAAKTETQAANSSAYTQKITLGSFKGRTPADILIKNPELKDSLIKTRDFLHEKSAQYAANKTQVAAIDEALKLFEDGKLSADVADAEDTGSDIYTIYESDFKFKSKTDPDGFHLCYMITVICDMTKKYPYAVSIENCYAPIVDGVGGRKATCKAQKRDAIKSTILLTEDEWVSVISSVRNSKILFEEMSFADLFAESKANEFKPAVNE